jgi:hypothetical protein
MLIRKRLFKFGLTGNESRDACWFRRFFRLSGQVECKTRREGYQERDRNRERNKSA